MERGGIREAIADLHFEIVRAAAIIPDGWDHAAIKNVQVHLGKPTGAPESVDKRLSRNELLPHRSQGLNLLTWGRRQNQHCHVEIATRDRPASRARVHYQDRIHMRMCREEIPGQLGQLSVELRRESQW
jgi:hypothetical protein